MLFVLTFVATSAETTLPRAAATDVGMSAERLENLKEVMARHLASPQAPVRSGSSSPLPAGVTWFFCTPAA